MIKLQWTFNGRRVAPGQLGREVTKSIQGEILNSAKNAVDHVLCPVHGTAARNIKVGRGAGRLRFEYDACCDRLEEAIAAHLR